MTAIGICQITFGIEATMNYSQVQRTFECLREVYNVRQSIEIAARVYGATREEVCKLLGFDLKYADTLQ